MRGTVQKPEVEVIAVPWRAYRVVLRLSAPLHSGWRKVGNLQMTRPYVTGRMLWGALTLRLTRDGARAQPAVDSGKYQEIGKQVNERLAFTYFYPALQNADGYRIFWPWENEINFRRRFLGSYASTALSYPQQAAAEGSLHEVEFISPHTMDDGQTVYLLGYIFERDGCSPNWRSAIRSLQLGGERGYGWGRVELVDSPKEITDGRIFNGVAAFEGLGERPLLSVANDGRLLAHTRAASDFLPEGEIEPLVGREWRSTNAANKYAGQHVEFTGVCFVPGSKLNRARTFLVGHFGVWEAR